MLRGGLRRRCILTRASAQQAHAAGTDEQSEHDEDDAENDFATNDCDDAADDKEDREDPQDEVHGRSVPARLTFKRGLFLVVHLTLACHLRRAKAIEASPKVKTPALTRGSSGGRYWV